MEKKEIKKHIKKASVVGGITVGFIWFVAAFITLSNMGNILYDEPTVETVRDKSWNFLDFPAVGDNNPGEFGWLNFSVVDYNDFTYTTNITHNSSVYASYDSNDSGMASRSVPHSTPFDITLKILLNVTWEDSDGTFQKDYLRAWCNASNISPAISTGLGTIYNITGTGDPNHYWVYAVWDNGGSGYTLTDGGEETDCSFTFEGFFVQGGWNN